MRKIHATLSLALVAVAGILQPLVGHAQDAPAPLAAVSLAAAQQGQCAALALPAASNGMAEALLGGQPSQLELLQRQQASALVGGRGAAANGARTGDCSAMVAAHGAALLQAGRGSLPHGDDDFLASKRLPVSHTSFDGQWNRVLAGTLPRSAAAAFAGLAGGGDGGRLLSAVNAYANHRIRYVEDRALYGRADYWADAGATLARGAGDCEDIAIAKLQLLAAAGVPRGDMFLTIARDPVRKADHALLIVRQGGRYWLLDNAGDRVVDAAQSYDYRPIMSFSADGRWLHGY